MSDGDRGSGGSDRRDHLIGLPGGAGAEPGSGPESAGPWGDRDLRVAAALMSDAQRIANFGSWEWRLADDVMVWSDQLYRILDRDSRSFVPSIDGYLDCVHPDDRDRVAEAIRRSLQTAQPFRVEHRIEGPAGSGVVRCQGEPLPDPGGLGQRMIGVCQDVTELAEAERARGVADARFRSAFEHAPVGVALADFEQGPEGVLVDVNHALCDLLGRSEPELIGTALADLGLPEEREETVRMHERLIAGELEQIAVERRCQAAGGRIIWTLFHISVVRDADGAASGIVQVQDISERKEFEDQLRHVADHDSLTGLLNRRRFSEELESQLAQKKRYGGTAAALVIDVDNLKRFNDSHGHSAGDEALRSVANALSHRLRATDIVARLGGDEFALLLPNADFTEADGLAVDLLARLAQQEIFGIPVSVSIGVCVFDGANWTSPEQVIADADSAMYKAKQGGGGAYERSVPAPDIAGEAPQREPPREPHEYSRRDDDPPRVEPPPPVEPPEFIEPPTVRVPRLVEAPPLLNSQPGEEISAGLEPEPATAAPPGPAAPPAYRPIRELVADAIRNDDLLLYAQPVFDLRSGEVAHQELLVRMRGEASSVLAASEFLGVAAQDPGLCTQVDLWVVRSAIRALTTGRLSGRLQVNLSGETLASSAAREQIASEVTESRIEPGSLAFEVAEAAIDRDVEVAIEGLEMLSKAGCPIVLDGFSAGFGSLEFLQRLPLEQIKIDGSVVRELEREDGDHATLRAIVKLARGSKRTTVAKLVESDALLPLLRMHGVDMAQGFELGEPEPVG